MATGSDARKKADPPSGSKPAAGAGKAVPRTDKVPAARPDRPVKTDKVPAPRAEKVVPKTDKLATANAEKLLGPLPFLAPPVKPESPIEGYAKTAEFEIPSAAFFVDTRSELDRAGPLPPPPSGAPELPPPVITDRVAGPDTKRYRKKVKEGTERMKKPQIPVYDEEAARAAQAAQAEAIPGPLPPGAEPPKWENPRPKGM